MGVDINMYTFWGIRVPTYDEEFVEKYEEKYGYSNRSKSGGIFDGMSGEYMVLGCILFDSGNIRYGELHEGFMQQDIRTIPALEEDYREKFLEDFPEYAYLLSEPFQIISFTHFLEALLCS